MWIWWILLAFLILFVVVGIIGGRALERDNKKIGMRIYVHTIMGINTPGDTIKEEEIRDIFKFFFSLSLKRQRKMLPDDFVVIFHGEGNEWDVEKYGKRVAIKNVFPFVFKSEL